MTPIYCINQDYCLRAMKSHENIYLMAASKWGVAKIDLVA